jgi:hypothetical protein
LDTLNGADASKKLRKEERRRRRRRRSELQTTGK